MKYAVLIDAGFIKRKLGSRRSPLNPRGVSQFLASVYASPALAQMTLYRVYWYDAPPLDARVSKPLRGGAVNFGATNFGKANLVLLDALCVMPHVSVRRGDLVFRGWKVRQGRLPKHEPLVTLSAADLEPSIYQKGVDMRLGLDIASLTLKAHVGAIVLVTGDSDFVPAMKFARREGVQILLLPLGHTVRADMLEHSDLILEMPRDGYAADAA